MQDSSVLDKMIEIIKRKLRNAGNSVGQDCLLNNIRSWMPIEYQTRKPFVIIKPPDSSVPVANDPLNTATQLRNFFKAIDFDNLEANMIFELTEKAIDQAKSELQLV